MHIFKHWCIYIALFCPFQVKKNFIWVAGLSVLRNNAQVKYAVKYDCTSAHIPFANAF